MLVTENNELKNFPLEVQSPILAILGEPIRDIHDLLQALLGLKSHCTLRFVGRFKGKMFGFLVDSVRTHNSYDEWGIKHINLFSNKQHLFESFIQW